MHFELQIQNVESRELPIRAYDPELDDVGSILGDLCEAVKNEALFVVSAFGQDRWPVDVRTDLVIFLEQLPRALHEIQLGLPAVLDFYEQGIERTLSFSPVGDQYSVTCLSLTDWRPVPAIEVIGREPLETMLKRVMEKFLGLIGKIAPSLVEHPRVQAWIEGENEGG